MFKPDLYESLNRPQLRDVAEFSEEFVVEISEMSGRCLDVGSGPGNTVVDLVLQKMNAKANIVCSDISESMVNFGREKYKDNPRLSFIKLDIETPDLPEDLIEQFDHVTSFYCLHWCQDMRQVFENIYHLLRPGGTVFAIFAANFPSANAYPELATIPRYQPYMKDAERYIPVYQNSAQPRKALKTLIEDVGFEVRHCSVRERSHAFHNLDLFGKLMLSLNPFVERIPAHLQEDYEKDLGDAITRQNIVFNKNNSNDRDYSVLLTFQAFFIYLRKPCSK